MTVPIRLYELTGARDDIRFSPYCWRTRFALAHKELGIEGIAWRFSDKEAIAASGQGKVPVIVDGDRHVSDSWAIAEYLEAQYSDRPSLFGSDATRALTHFINQWTDVSVHPALARLLLPEIHDILAEADKDYFRSTRESMLGASFEQLRGERDQWLAKLREILAPLRRTLSNQPFITGEAPAYADHIVAGTFQWARICSTQPVLAEDDPVSEWMDRMLDAYAGMARQAPVAHPA
ncbi:glutathione S-transferase family protein [Pseudomonas sp. Marseille-QA0892]